MSVIAYYARLDESRLELLRQQKDWQRALQSGGIPGARVTDIDKALDGLIWILNKMPAPPAPAVEGAGFVLQVSPAPKLQGDGGTREPRLEAGYGPASRLSTQQVQDLSGWMSAMEPAQLRMRYNAQAMATEEVYPQIWVEEGLAAFDEYLLPSFEGLRAFFADAANAGQCVLVFFD